MSSPQWLNLSPRWRVVLALGLVCLFGAVHVAVSAHHISAQYMSHGVASSAPTLGTVERRISAGSYTYLKVAFDGGDTEWVVTMGSGPEVGQRASVRSFGARTDFYSKRLHRRFHKLIFASVTNTLQPLKDNP